MSKELQEKLEIGASQLAAINGILLDPDMKIIQDLLEVVEKYGTPEEINAKAEEAGKLQNLLQKVEKGKPEFIKDLEWLQEQRDRQV